MRGGWLRESSRVVFRKKKRKTTRITTLIGQHTEVVGDIRFSGGLHIDGTVRGRVYAENDGTSLLSLSDQGTIEGDVAVPYMEANGSIIGDVRGYEHVELAPKARISGNVYYALLEMENGAEVNGQLVHEMDAPQDGHAGMAAGDPGSNNGES